MNQILRKQQNIYYKIINEKVRQAILNKINLINLLRGCEAKI